MKGYFFKVWYDDTPIDKPENILIVASELHYAIERLETSPFTHFSLVDIQAYDEIIMVGVQTVDNI